MNAEGIVRELAGTHPGDREFDWQCVYCYSEVPEHWKTGSGSITELRFHDDDCLWVKAVRYAVDHHLMVEGDVHPSTEEVSMWVAAVADKLRGKERGCRDAC